jgi:O-antigen/teichoic acid export membrane protein
MTLNSVFNGLGKTRLTLNITLVNFAILLILSPVFAQAYGVVGAIIAFLVAGVVASAYAAFVAVRQLKIRFNFKVTLRIYLISVLSTFPTLGLLAFVNYNSMVILALGLVMYFFVFVTLMPLLKIVNMKELESLTRIAGRIPLLNIFAKLLFTYQLKIHILIDRSSK